ncbi:hypothetical protein AAHE18_04G181500 [Arachis hypogaea]
MVVPVITAMFPVTRTAATTCVLRRRQQDFERQKRRWLARVSLFSPLLPSSLSLALSGSSISGGNRLQDEDDDDVGTVAAATASRCGQRWRREKGSNTVVGLQLGLRFCSLSLASLSSPRGLLDAGANSDATAVLSCAAASSRYSPSLSDLLSLLSAAAATVAVTPTAPPHSSSPSPSFLGPFPSSPFSLFFFLMGFG